MQQKGFTLIELLVVLAIIGILSVIGFFAFEGFTKGAYDLASDQNIELKSIRDDLISK